jgi:hypothetical protein
MALIKRGMAAPLEFPVLIQAPWSSGILMLGRIASLSNMALQPTAGSHRFAQGPLAAAAEFGR